MMDTHSFIRKLNTPVSFHSSQMFCLNSNYLHQSAVQTSVVSRIVAQVALLLLATEFSLKDFPALQLNSSQHFFPLEVR